MIRHVLWYLNTLFSTLKDSKDHIGGEKPKYSCAKEMYHFSIFVLSSMIQRSIMKIFKIDFLFQIFLSSKPIAADLKRNFKSLRLCYFQSSWWET